jgi:hypothetical protein
MAGIKLNALNPLELLRVAVVVAVAEFIIISFSFVLFGSGRRKLGNRS